MTARSVAWAATEDSSVAQMVRGWSPCEGRENEMEIGMWHHCGACDCCGGDIPCGGKYIRRWRKSGECPGHTKSSICGALISATPRKKPLASKAEQAAVRSA